MSDKTDDIVDLIYKKIKSIKSKKVYLEKDEFKRFIYSILKESQFNEFS